MTLKNKVIILTGGTRIGQTVAKELILKGANLALTYLNSRDTAQTIIKLANDAGTKAIAVQTNVSKSEDIINLVDETIKTFGRIDGLVHMAAIYQKTPWSSLKEEDWEPIMDVIAKSAFLLGKIVGDVMLKNSKDNFVQGKMINISDWSVLTRPYKDYLIYNTAKSAVAGLTKSLAKELAPNILVNCIAPGPILKPSNLSKESEEEVLSNTPLGRWGGSEEIAKAVIYLMEADFVTGQTLFVDGGRSIG